MVDILKFHEVCYRGDFDLIKKMLSDHECLSDHASLSNENGFFDILLRTASMEGYLEIAHLMLEKGATDFNGSLISACVGGSLDIVKLMISLGATEFSEGFFFAASKNHKDIMKFIASKMSDTLLENNYIAFSQESYLTFLKDILLQEKKNRIIFNLFLRAYPSEIVNYMLERYI